ncbi:MAG: glycogen/starch/alpha-glucan phosphorylase [Proteobacteria bacterium]|nr:glycogen/starch/alpha-glucan phosphorylase [Pseudomonadota bacterium]
MSKPDYTVFFTDHKTADTYSLANQFAEHIELSLVKDKSTVTKEDAYNALAMSIRDRLIRRWLRTQRQYREHDAKRVYYLSLEYLMGRLLGNALNNLRYYEECAQILDDLGYKLDEIREIEHDMGLGNGGLGRLAACFLDSMATQRLPAYAYGLRYEYGIFDQKIENGYQVEVPDNWLTYRNPWEVIRPELTYRIRFGGNVQKAHLRSGETIHTWVDTDDVMAVAYDIPVPGYGNNVVNNLRLWQAKSTQDVDFTLFQTGDYLQAVRRKSGQEAISKFLYPNDDNYSGKVLRLKQQYFFVSATLQDIIRIHKRQHKDLSDFHEKIAIQLNDTHPSIAIAELMRILLDEERMPWELSWDIVRRTFAYTNHTIMAEALERWPVSIMQSLLPRHMDIVYEINRRFMDEVGKVYPGDVDRLRRMSIIEEGAEKRVRMANLAIVGSFAVNGVAELHTRILKERIFPDFNEFYPNKFINITNGITQRRWLQKANPILSEVIDSRIGDGWALDLNELRRLEDFASDEEFSEAWQSAKWSNKNSLAQYIGDTMGIDVDVNSMFDVQIKRIHEYKRQLLNILHAIALYNEIKDNPNAEFTPRTVIFAGKAAPGYRMAKLIIKLINSVAGTINLDPATKDVLKVVFLRNYSVSLAERIIPAADLSEQISTAGTEASGTGNMKLALNGALTIGTMDGANIEIAETVGRENLFVFGYTEEEIEQQRRQGYFPMSCLEKDERLRRAVQMIAEDHFNWREPGIFQPIVDSLLRGGDRFFVLADFGSYAEKQREAAKLFNDKREWTKRAILTAARMGRFSSDRTVAEYSSKVWGTNPEEY